MKSRVLILSVLVSLVLTACGGATPPSAPPETAATSAASI
jgi:hypothetical protein